MGFSRGVPNWTQYEETYPTYEERLLNPDEDASSRDPDRADRWRDYSPNLPDASPHRRSAPQQESDSMRRPSRDAARVPSLSDARRERDKAA